MRKASFAAIFAVISLFSGCIPRKITVRATAGLIKGGISAVYEESDPQFAREALPGQLKLMEVLLKNDPKNADLLRSLAEGYTGYAYLFLEETDPKRAAALYKRASEYGLRLLARNARLRGLSEMNGAEIERTLRHAVKSDVPALFWTAQAWAGRANMAKNDASALANLPKAVPLMRRVLELNPDYQYGGADLFFGVYYAGRPKMAGGDPEKGKTYFESALKRTDRKFLTSQLMYAQYYAVAVMDEDLFKSLLREIDSAPADALAQAVLPNAVSKEKSRKLLEKIDELF